MFQLAQQLWTFLYAHFWMFTAIFVVIRYGKTLYRCFIFEPLSGADEKISLDEMAKGIVIAILIWAAQRDGYRQHEWAYFSDAFYAAFIAGLFAIAAIKPVVSVLKANKQKKQDNETRIHNRRDAGNSNDCDPLPEERLPRE